MAIYGEPFIARKKSKQQKQGRRCSFPKCDTVLSVYNDADRCALHANRASIRTRGRPKS